MLASMPLLILVVAAYNVVAFFMVGTLVAPNLVAIRKLGVLDVAAAERQLEIILDHWRAATIPPLIMSLRNAAWPLSGSARAAPTVWRATRLSVRQATAGRTYSAIAKKCRALPVSTKTCQIA